MNITITVNAGAETLNAINRLADGLLGNKSTTPTPSEKKENPLKSVPPKKEEAKENESCSDVKITVEMLREVVSSKKDAHKAKIKELLQGFGVSNVSALDNSHYTDFYSKVAAL